MPRVERRRQEHKIWQNEVRRIETTPVKYEHQFYNQSINQRNLYSASYSPERQRLTTKNTTHKI